MALVSGKSEPDLRNPFSASAGVVRRELETPARPLALLHAYAPEAEDSYFSRLGQGRPYAGRRLADAARRERRPVVAVTACL